MSTEHTELSKKKQHNLFKYGADFCKILFFSIAIRFIIFLFS